MPREQLIQIRRDTAANWTSVNPVLALAEQGLETDTRKSKYGDGTTAWVSLGYSVANSSGGGSGTALTVQGYNQTGAALAVGYITPEMFGAIAGINDATTRAINDAAFKAACEHRSTAGSKYGDEVRVGPNTYYLGVTLEPEGAFRLIGQGSGHSGGGIVGVAQTRMIWPTDVCSIRIRANGTDGTGVSAGKLGARDSYIQGISIEQATLGTNLNAHGVHMRGNATIKDCVITAAGDGFRIVADSSYVDPVTAGFADEWRVIECTIICGGDGIYTNGNEANAGYSQGVVFHQCGGCAIRERSYLANAHYSPQITGYGATGVQYLGRKYQLIVDTNTGTTPGTNAAIWYDIGALASAGGAFPAWNVATAYLARLPYLIFNSSPMFGVYHENGATIGYSTGVVYGTTGGTTHLTPVVTAGSDGAVTTPAGIGQQYSLGGDVNHPLYSVLGDLEYTKIGSKGNSTASLRQRSYLMKHGVKGYSLLWGYGLDGEGTGADIDLGYFNSKSMMKLTTPFTTQTFGRSTIQPNYAAFSDFALIDPNNAGYARVIGLSNAAPTTGNHAQGEFVFNVAPTSTGIFGWSCTTTGTPGTWTPISVALSFNNAAFTGATTFENGGPSGLADSNTAQAYLGYSGSSDYRHAITTRHGALASGSVDFWLHNDGDAVSANPTFKAFSIDGAAGVRTQLPFGYATGAGGAVTQITSRTTGVTLNKVCGQITLVSAAGTATWQTFTVTNSAVAATDTIHVNQASGTDLNMIHVTNVAAGSFKISFATTGGITTEQPVFNFAIIKSVAA